MGRLIGDLARGSHNDQVVSSLVRAVSTNRTGLRTSAECRAKFRPGSVFLGVSGPSGRNPGPDSESPTTRNPTGKTRSYAPALGPASVNGEAPVLTGASRWLFEPPPRADYSSASPAGYASPCAQPDAPPGASYHVLARTPRCAVMPCSPSGSELMHGSRRPAIRIRCPATKRKEPGASPALCVWLTKWDECTTVLRL